jgi:hypothetical protein
MTLPEGSWVPAHDPDAYWEAISLQTADRASPYATGNNQKFGRDGSRITAIDKRFGRRRFLDWVLTGGLGIVFFAGILYLTLRTYRDDSSLIRLIPSSWVREEVSSLWTRRRRRLTLGGCHLPPFGVGISRSRSSRVMAWMETKPAL